MHDPLDLTDENGQPFYLNPPLFLYILAFSYLLHGSSSFALAHYIVLFMGSTTVMITGLITKRMFNWPVAILSSALLATNALFVSNESKVLIDIPLTFFVFLALYFRITERNTLFLISAALATATKYPAAILFLLPFTEWMIKKSFYQAVILYCAGAIAAGIAIALLPNLHLPEGWWTYFTEFFSWPNWNALSRESFFVHPILLLLLTLGLWQTLKQKSSSPVLIWLLLFGLTRFFLPWHVHRYSLPLYPAIMIYAAYGVFCFYTMLVIKFPHWNQLPKIIITTLIVFALFTQTTRSASYTMLVSSRFRATQYLVPTVFLRSNKIDTILTGIPRQIKYYIPDAKVINLEPTLSPNDLPDLIKNKHIDAIVLAHASPHRPSWVIPFFSISHSFHTVFYNDACWILVPVTRSTDYPLQSMENPSSPSTRIP